MQLVMYIASPFMTIFVAKSLVDPLYVANHDYPHPDLSLIKFEIA